MRLIDADDFGNRMYHEAFEKDSDLQKWDSGCWIRYKLFENVLREQPTVQPDKDVIDDCLYHIYKNISVHTATGGVIAIRYYMEKLYEEIYGEGERPWWMK